MEWNEAQANEALAATAKQNRLDEQQYQARLANEAARQHKADKNAQFWDSIRWAVLAIVLAAIALFTLVRVAG